MLKRKHFGCLGNNNFAGYKILQTSLYLDKRRIHAKWLSSRCYCLEKSVLTPDTGELTIATACQEHYMFK